jgi:aryl-alcohol dehydrogenase-like predicted oxidoreductase
MLRPLGPWTLPAIGLGAMPLSCDGRPDRATARAVIHAALDAGTRLFDTADVYCLDDGDLGHNEALLAAALSEHPAGRESVVATKGGLGRPGGDWVSRAAPAQLIDACERSLRALRTDCIDLYQLHAPDDVAPIEDSVGALARLSEAGKIRHVGLSNVSADELARARAIVPIVSVQNRANILDRSAWDDGVIEACAAARLAFLPYCPVGGSSQRAALRRHRGLRAVAERLAATPEEIALAWLLQQVPFSLPIPGASRVASARSSVRAMDVHLSASDLAEAGAEA